MLDVMSWSMIIPKLLYAVPTGVHSSTHSLPLSSVVLTCLWFFTASCSVLLIPSSLCVDLRVGVQATLKSSRRTSCLSSTTVSWRSFPKESLRTSWRPWESPCLPPFASPATKGDPSGARSALVSVQRFCNVFLSVSLKENDRLGPAFCTGVIYLIL